MLEQERLFPSKEYLFHPHIKVSSWTYMLVFGKQYQQYHLLALQLEDLFLENMTIV